MIKIYYMTATGNSLKIAKDIGAELGDHELISMTHFLKNNEKIIIEGDVIGFVFPIYFARPPVFIREFIEKAEFVNVSYIFAVANGGGLFGRSLNIFESFLKKRGKALDASFIIGMPGTHPYITCIHRTPPAIHYKREVTDVEHIAEIVRRQVAYKTKRVFAIFESIFALFAFDVPYDLSKKHRMDTHFWINDGCRNCGLCIDICPVDNIIQSKWKPAWQNRCINCLACYHVCPWKGIELRCEWKMFDLVSYEQLEFRYRHPKISLEELQQQR